MSALPAVAATDAVAHAVPDPFPVFCAMVGDAESIPRNEPAPIIASGVAPPPYVTVSVVPDANPAGAFALHNENRTFDPLYSVESSAHDNPPPDTVKFVFPAKNRPANMMMRAPDAAVAVVLNDVEPAPDELPVPSAVSSVTAI
jgi:hypothetical protein